MIKYENGALRYFDRNGVEITDGCEIRFPHADKSLTVTKTVYLTEEGHLGTDATNPAWVASGRAVPCEYGVYPLTKEDTDLCEVVPK